jgi:PadR family transcriptional regulator, regulatory protein PadR
LVEIQVEMDINNHVGILHCKIHFLSLTILYYKVYKELESMSLRSQLLKGVLEGCILAIIKQESVYGYELSIKLQQFGLNDVSEGSIYPLLLRLQKAGLIEGEMRDSPSGPKRKYYHLTEKGEEALQDFITEWESIRMPVETILRGGEVI